MTDGKKLYRLLFIFGFWLCMFPWITHAAVASALSDANIVLVNSEALPEAVTLPQENYIIQVNEVFNPYGTQTFTPVGSNVPDGSYFSWVGTICGGTYMQITKIDTNDGNDVYGVYFTQPGYFTAYYEVTFGSKTINTSVDFTVLDENGNEPPYVFVLNQTEIVTAFYVEEDEKAISETYVQIRSPLLPDVPAPQWVFTQTAGQDIGTVTLGENPAGPRNTLHITALSGKTGTVSGDLQCAYKGATIHVPVTINVCKNEYPMPTAISLPQAQYNLEVNEWFNPYGTHSFMPLDARPPDGARFIWGTVSDYPIETEEIETNSPYIIERVRFLEAGQFTIYYMVFWGTNPISVPITVIVSDGEDPAYELQLTQNSINATLYVQGQPGLIDSTLVSIVSPRFAGIDDPQWAFVQQTGQNIATIELYIPPLAVNPANSACLYASEIFGVAGDITGVISVSYSGATIDVPVAIHVRSDSSLPTDFTLSSGTSIQLKQGDVWLPGPDVMFLPDGSSMPALAQGVFDGLGVDSHYSFSGGNYRDAYILFYKSGFYAIDFSIHHENFVITKTFNFTIADEQGNPPVFDPALYFDQSKVTGEPVITIDTTDGSNILIGHFFLPMQLPGQSASWELIHESGSAADVELFKVEDHSTYLIYSTTTQIPGRSTYRIGCTYNGQTQWVRFHVDVTINKQSSCATFHANAGAFDGGGITKDVIQTLAGKYVLPNAAPTRAGYAFRGWNTLADGTGVYITAESTVNTLLHHTLYATWERVSKAGDANVDGAVDIMDLVVIVDYIVNGNAPVSMTGADANGDGSVDIMDLVFIINLIVNPPVSSGTQVDATAGNMISVEVPFQSAVPITALKLTYTLSPGLTFVSAECTGMTGTGGDTGAMFANANGGATAGMVTLTVRVQNGITENQSVNVTAVTGASTAGTRSVGTPQTYGINMKASTLSILTQPVDTTVSVGNTATFTVEAAGPKPLMYQWYVNTNTGVGWLAIAGATENTYTTGPAVTGDDGFRYFCRVTAGESYLDSAVATLTVVASPQTGDSSHPYWLFALALLAASSFLLTLSQRRSRV